jgi:hypothetical protein
VELVNNFSMSGIQASSHSAESLLDVSFNDYDVLILTSSWDNRCKILTNSTLKKIPVCICLVFDDKDNDGIRDENDIILLKYAESISNKCYTVSGLSTDVDKVWNELFNTLLNVRQSTNRALSILYDLSCSPRFYSLTLLSTSFKFGLAKKVDYFYNECIYPEKVDELSKEEIPFTAGKWVSRHIRYLEGPQNPGKKNRFSVSIGFEGSKTLMILNEFEPDKVNVIIPNPGYTDGYVSRVRTANQELFKSFGVKTKDEVQAHAAEPISVWTEMVTRLAQNVNWNDTLLCAGTKPHSLGLALAAMTLNFPTLIYSLPSKHNPIFVKPSSRCWLYSITNIIVP